MKTRLGHETTMAEETGSAVIHKSLLRFNTASLPSQAVVDEATLELYYTGRSNGNTLTLGAHKVLAEWTDSEVNRIRRKTGNNWAVAGMWEAAATMRLRQRRPWPLPAQATSGCNWM